jgi:hypothetical protein
MIGTKTISTMALLSAALFAAVAAGALTPERLSTRGFGALFVAACFGVVVGTLAHRFWRLGEKSRHYLRWTDDAELERGEGHFVGGGRRRVVIGQSSQNREGEALDLGPRAQHAACIACASLVALAALDTRAFAELDRFHESTGSVASSYCPEEEEEKKPPARDPNEPGCELLRRAFALGYATSLGPCAPKKGVAAVLPPPCTRRQRDEPLLHYSWRRLATFVRGVGAAGSGAARVANEKRELAQRATRLASLGRAEEQILTSAPHASHHVWTNLPAPPLDSAPLFGQTCESRFHRLAHRPTPSGEKQASAVFEHVMGQLLFEGTYDPPAGHCREYHVHWGAPLDACARIAANPRAELAQAGALTDVRAVLERHRLDADLAPLSGATAPGDPSAFISFHCYFEGAPPPTTMGRASTPFTLDGRAFTVEELRIPPSPANAPLFVDRYDAVAQLLVRGFHYGPLLSEAGLELGSPHPGLEGVFAGSDFLLTRLYELEDADLYLDPAWIAGRPDLLEVYPFERHLANYVRTFRRQYRRSRGRL